MGNNVSECCRKDNIIRTNVDGCVSLPYIRWRPQEPPPGPTVSTDMLLDFSFNSFEYDPQPLCLCYAQMLQFIGVQAANRLDTPLVVTYAEEVARRYNQLPYHNFYHAFSITQFLFGAFVKSGSVATMLSSYDVLAMFVASLVHDVEHPGNNNAFEIATKSALARRYNDSSVLENHHAAVGLQILAQEKCNMFSNLGGDVFNEVRETFTQVILQTDMAVHFRMVEQLKMAKSKTPEPFSREVLAERRCLAGHMLHAVDISNSIVPKFDLARNWAERISQEFRSQFVKEAEQGLTPTAMWANLHTPLGFYKSQVNFIEFIVAPMWLAVLDILPNLDKNSNLRQTLVKNTNQWNQLIQAEEQKREASGGSENGDAA